MGKKKSSVKNATNFMGDVSAPDQTGAADSIQKRSQAAINDIQAQSQASLDALNQQMASSQQRNSSYQQQLESNLANLMQSQQTALGVQRTQSDLEKQLLDLQKQQQQAMSMANTDRFKKQAAERNFANMTGRYNRGFIA